MLSQEILKCVFLVLTESVDCGPVFVQEPEDIIFPTDSDEKKAALNCEARGATQFPITGRNSLLIIFSLLKIPFSEILIHPGSIMPQVISCLSSVFFP